jgi:hypothetical protein
MMVPARLIHAAAMLLVTLLGAQVAHACPTRTVEPVQALVRRAFVVAEGIATGALFEMHVSRFWKGNAAATIRLCDVSTDAGECNSSEATEKGKRYLFFIESQESVLEGGVELFPGNAKVWSLDDFPEMLRYFDEPVPLSADSVLQMMRAWRDGSVADASMKRWVEEMLQVAETGDWVYDEEGPEWSPTLSTLQELDARLYDAGSDPCRLNVIRERLVPVFIRELADPFTLTPESEIEELHRIDERLCGGS